jgi:PadR family transcriptional regulator PadR
MHMSPDPKPRTELVPGTLILLVLRVLESEPLHGYAIAQRISQVSGEVLRVEEGSLYPALQKMLRNGWVRAEWGLSDTNRRVRSYRLTPAGRKQLESERTGYDHVNRAIQAVLKLA